MLVCDTCWWQCDTTDKLKYRTSQRCMCVSLCVCLHMWMCVLTLCLADGWWVEFPSHYYLSFQCASRELRTSSREEGEVGDWGWAVVKGYTWNSGWFTFVKIPFKILCLLGQNSFSNSREKKMGHTLLGYGKSTKSLMLAWISSKKESEETTLSLTVCDARWNVHTGCIYIFVFAI